LPGFGRDDRCSIEIPPLHQMRQANPALRCRSEYIDANVADCRDGTGRDDTHIGTNTNG